ncbi:hypothetical protein BC826DRAFT_513178 [Russula brevipes]|nr:hypothetical protein BC826DRAFT_513178 [Russula brevipes]
MVQGYCPTAQRGGTCTNPKCSKNHNIVHCLPCKCFLPAFSLQQHQTGRQHLQNIASKGSPAPKTPQKTPPAQSTPSSRQSAPPANTPPSSESTAAIEPGVTASHKVVQPTAAAYCATTLQGDTCVDSRCSYSHDISCCEPCGRSFPASLFEEHMNGNSHLEKVVPKLPPLRVLPGNPLLQSQFCQLPDLLQNLLHPELPRRHPGATRPSYKRTLASRYRMKTASISWRRALEL